MIKVLAMNNIELGMLISTIESRASKISRDEGNNYTWLIESWHRGSSNMIIVKCVRVNMDFQIPLLIIGSDHICIFANRRVTHLSCINARVEWIIGKWVFVQSLGWDPRRHERFRNVPENKIHIMESKGSRKFRYFTSIVSDILESSGVGTEVGPHVRDQRGPEGRWFDLMGQGHKPSKGPTGQP
jgi:hypothetical protein